MGYMRHPAASIWWHKYAQDGDGPLLQRKRKCRGIQVEHARCEKSTKKSEETLMSCSWKKELISPDRKFDGVIRSVILDDETEDETMDGI